MYRRPDVPLVVGDLRVVGHEPNVELDRGLGVDERTELQDWNE